LSPSFQGYGSPETPPGLWALVNTFGHKDFCLSSEKSNLEAICQANNPISYNIDLEDPELLDPFLSVDSQLLMTINWATRTEVLCLAHELPAANILLVQAKIKYKLMEKDAYIAKIIRVKSLLKETYSSDYISLLLCNNSLISIDYTQLSLYTWVIKEN
jgi:hypothetical protein